MPCRIAARLGRALRQNRRMRLSDRPWAETNAHGAENLRAGWDHQSRPDDLAGRLTRLPPGHPSADPAGAPDDDLGPEPVDPDELDPDELDPDELDPDDLGPEGPGPDGDIRPGRSGHPQVWRELGESARSPYRPWFGAGGATDPWFAADLTE
jgi:hypothetical protein